MVGGHFAPVPFATEKEPSLCSVISGMEGSVPLLSCCALGQWTLVSHRGFWGGVNTHACCFYCSRRQVAAS